MPRLLPTNTISQPRPLLRLPLPPPSPYPGFYDLSGIFKQGPCSSPCLGKIIGMTFLCRNVPGFCQQIFALFLLVLTNPFFHEKSLLSNINPPLLYSCRRNPSIEPWTAKFCTQYANDFANPANPVFIPVFPFFNKQW